MNDKFKLCFSNSIILNKWYEIYKLLMYSWYLDTKKRRIYIMILVTFKRKLLHLKMLWSKKKQDKRLCNGCVCWIRLSCCSGWKLRNVHSIPNTTIYFRHFRDSSYENFILDPKHYITNCIIPHANDVIRNNRIISIQIMRYLDYVELKL